LTYLFWGCKDMEMNGIMKNSPRNIEKRPK